MTSRRRALPGVSAGLCGAGTALAVYASAFVVPYGELSSSPDPLVVSDASGLSSARVSRILPVGDEAGARAALREARERGLGVSTAGRRHSLPSAVPGRSTRRIFPRPPPHPLRRTT